MRITQKLKIVVAALTLAVACSVSAADTHVRQYTKKNGTTVAPHHRTAPDKTKANNYSTKGNMNPYTGKKGTVDPNKAPTKSSKSSASR